MNPESLRRLLESVRDGSLNVDEAGRRLERLPVEPMDEATLDNHRELRCGFPEVVFGQGKTVDQITAIAERLVLSGGALLATRLAPEAIDALEGQYPD